MWEGSKAKYSTSRSNNAVGIVVSLVALGFLCVPVYVGRLPGPLKIFAPTRTGHEDVQSPFLLRNFNDTINSTPKASSPSFFANGFEFGVRHPSAPAVLFAHLQGPRGEHFACFLRPQGEEYRCPDSQALDAGLWNVSVTLVRLQKGSAVLGNTSLLDLITRRNMAYFEELKPFVEYPGNGKRLFTFSWNKTARPVGLLPAAKAARCSTEDPAGVWVPFSAPCQPPLCAGTVDQDLFNAPINANMSMRHIFAPFSCHYYFFSKEEATACLATQQVMFVGDSRTRHLVDHVRMWLGDVQGLGHIGLENPYHFGLGRLLNSEQAEELRMAVARGRTVVMNSVLHDMADFYRFSGGTAMEDVRLYYDAALCSKCKKDTAKECKCKKPYAVQRFMANVDRLRVLLQEAWVEGGRTLDEEAPHYWVSMNKCPPPGKGKLFSWQSADSVFELEDYARRRLGASAARHIDLRPHALAAPVEWWVDEVHYQGKGQTFFNHVSLQVILNHICPVPEQT